MDRFIVLEYKGYPDESEYKVCMLNKFEVKKPTYIILADTYTLNSGVKVSNSFPTYEKCEEAINDLHKDFNYQKVK